MPPPLARSGRQGAGFAVTIGGAHLAAWLCVLLWLLPTLAQAREPALVYAPLPLENLALTQARNRPLVERLTALLERPVKMRLYPDYAALLEALIQADVDLVELGPLPFLLARAQVSELRAVATFREPNGQAHYRCVLVAPVDGIQALFQLAQHKQPLRLALTRPESTCGPTASFWLLAEHGLDPAAFQATYQGGHDAVALAVLRNMFTLGGVKDSVARDFHGLGLRVLAASEPMPGFVLAANVDRLGSDALEALQAALLALPEEQRTALQNGRHGFATFEPDLFEQLEAMGEFAAGSLDPVAD